MAPRYCAPLMMPLTEPSPLERVNVAMPVEVLTAELPSLTLPSKKSIVPEAVLGETVAVRVIGVLRPLVKPLLLVIDEASIRGDVNPLATTVITGAAAERVLLLLKIVGLL